MESKKLLYNGGRLIDYKPEQAQSTVSGDLSSMHKRGGGGGGRCR